MSNCSQPIDADVFGGIGAPTGMFLITGSGISVALLNDASNVPMLIGPSTVTPFYTKVIDAVGCVQSDPWNVCALFVKVMAFPLLARATSVSIELLPLEPCQEPLDVLHGGPVAQSAVPLPLNVTVPAVSTTALPLYVAVCEIVRFPSKKIEPLIASVLPGTVMPETVIDDEPLFQIRYPFDVPLCAMQA